MVHATKKQAEIERFTDVEKDFQKLEVLKIAKQMGKTNQDIVGEKCVRNDVDD